MCPRCTPHRGGGPADLAGLTSPFLETEPFRNQTEPGLDVQLADRQGENAFRLGVEGEIIGANDMDAVANSLAIPYRWICRLDIDYDITPFGTTQRLTGGGRGTGTLLSPCHVLTAAHNLVDYDPVRKNTLRATRIRVTPAHDGSPSPPVASVEADLSQSPLHPSWDITRRYDATGGPHNAGEVETNRYDYALLKLKSAIGDTQVRALSGPLGYWGSQGSRGAARFQRLEPAVLSSRVAFVAGYGSDDCVRAARTARGNPNIRFGSQLTATGHITLVMEGVGPQYVGRSMTHDIDTCGGQSGAPVALELDGVYYLVGVHTGAVSLTSGGRANHAVRLTMEMSTQVSDWMRRAPCPTAARELEDGGSQAGEQFALVEEHLAPDPLDRGGEDETEVGLAGEAPAGPAPTLAATPTSKMDRSAAIAEATAMINRFRIQTQAAAWHASLNRKAVADRLLALINNPDLVDQTANGLCGEAAFFNIWLWEDPLAVARFGVQLYNGGAAAVGTEEWVRPRPSLLAQNFDNVVTQINRPNARAAVAEWMMMSALRDANNYIFSYEGVPSDKWGAGSTDREVARWLRATNLFGSVTAKTGGSEEHNFYYASQLVPGSNAIMISCDSHMLGNPMPTGGITDDHWFVLKSAITDFGGTIDFRFWSWGEPTQWVNDRRADPNKVGTPLPGNLQKAQFTDEYFGYLIAKR
jgi:V8-like Glu-specific endopeptidase